MVDGNAGRITTLEGLHQMYPTGDPEAIEFVERASAIPFSFRRAAGGDCAMPLVWLRGR